jgi:hypothetical protein
MTILKKTLWLASKAEAFLSAFKQVRKRRQISGQQNPAANAVKNRDLLPNLPAESSRVLGR